MPFPQSDNFPLIKARVKILLSCHQDSWFISSSPSFHLFPRKHPVWHVSANSSNPTGLCTQEGAIHPGRVALAPLPLLVLNAYLQFFTLEGRGLANPRLFQELEETPGEASLLSHSTFARYSNQREVTARQEGF